MAVPTKTVKVEQDKAVMTELFPSNILTDLDLSNCPAVFKPLISISEPGEGLRVRSLCLEDYDSGFLELLGQLTSVGDISREEWETRFLAMKSCMNTYYVVVVEDRNLARVIGAATLVGWWGGWRMWWCQMSTGASSWGSWWCPSPPSWPPSWGATRSHSTVLTR